MDTAHPTPHAPKAPRLRRASRGERLAILGLIALSIVPMLAGLVRVAQLTIAADSTPITPANERFYGAPLPVMVHIVSSIAYALLGALQFAPSFRLNRPGWHQRIGWLIVPCGLASALTGLWMAHFYPWPAGDGTLLYAMRLFVGFTKTVALLLGVRAAQTKRFAKHGAWMVRAYALGMGAGTQVVTAILWAVFGGGAGEFGRNVIMGGGWLINMVIAEWVIRRRLTSPRRRTTVVPAHPA